MRQAVSSLWGCLCWIVWASALLPLQGADFYVAPTGTTNGTGTLTDPWSIQTALNHPASLQPGDTIWLRGGTYPAPATPNWGRTFFSYLRGTEAQPILLRQYPGEGAVVDGGIYCSKSACYFQFWGFRITNTDTNRLVTSLATLRSTGLFIESRGVKVINMVIDNSSTPIWWSDSELPNGDNGEIYGCIIWGGGAYDALSPPGDVNNPWIRGSAIYAQNVNGSRYIQDCICFRNFTTGPLVYATEGGANGFTIEGNISFDPGGDSAIQCATTDHPITSLNVVSNYVYAELSGPMLRLGYQSRTNQGAYVAGNYIAGLGGYTSGLFYVQHWDSATIVSNTFYSFGDLKAVVALDRKGGFPTFPLRWNNNSYYCMNPNGFVTNGAVPQLSLAEWQTLTRYDQASTYINAAPTNLVSFLRRNKYDPARSHLAVFNWVQATTLHYDLAQAGLRLGDRFEVRDAQNYLAAPAVAGMFTGAPVALPLTLTNVSPIYGTLRHFANKHTPSAFNAFVILNLGGAPTNSTGNATNTPPSLSGIADQWIEQNTVTPAIPFGVGDAETSASALIVTASSSNTDLVPNENILLGGSEGSRTITIAPALNRFGTTLISVSAIDGWLMTTKTFALHVLDPSNSSPTITVIPDQVTSPGTPTPILLFSVADAETATASLDVTAGSSNPSLVPAENIRLLTSAGRRGLVVTPAANQLGTAVITLTVSDGARLTTTSFTLLVRDITTLTMGPLLVGVNGVGRVTPNLNGRILTFGKAYTMVAAPGLGQIFAGWTGNTNSSAARLVFGMQSNMVLQANFVPNPFLPVQGSYNGLFFEPTQVRHESSGFFAAAVTPRGTFSGSIQVNGRRYSLSGQFDTAGRATKQVRRSPTNWLTVDLSLDLIHGTDEMTGTLSDGSWTAGLWADRATFHALTNPPPFAGKYTMSIAGDPAATSSPAGDGFGTLSVDLWGRVRLAGELADGTKFTQYTPLSRAGKWPLYLSLYGGKGSVLSWMTITSGFSENLQGLLSWNKPVMPLARMYPAGFNCDCLAFGSSYVPTAALNRALTWTNGVVVFGGGNLVPGLTNTVVFRSNGQVANTGGNRLNATFALSTGKFTGTVLDPITRQPVPFRGVLLQGRDGGTGYAVGTNQTGFVRLEAAP